MENIALVILAAGKGKRMNSDLPKVLLPIKNRPMLLHLLTAVNTAGFANQTVIITGIGSDLVKKETGQKYRYVFQKEQLGTGHAVQCAEKLLRGKAKHVLVLYGDHPLVCADTIKTIAQAHLDGKNPITMATMKVDDFNDWRAGFKDYGRIIRNGNGEIARIVEKKDANKEELAVTEVNPSYFCFEALWLWKNLKRIKNNNAQHEYYLTSLPELARKDGYHITTVSIKPVTALGANTPEQLATLEKIAEEQHVC